MKAPGHWTIDTLFEGRPAARMLYERIEAYIRSLGTVRVEAAKTQVSFGTQRKFAWVWLPQMWIKKRPENSVTLAFDLGRRVRSARIASAVEPRPGRWTHHVLIDKPADLAPDVRRWLREAYQNSLKPKAARRAPRPRRGPEV